MKVVAKRQFPLNEFLKVLKNLNPFQKIQILIDAQKSYSAPSQTSNNHGAQIQKVEFENTIFLAEISRRRLLL